MASSEDIREKIIRVLRDADNRPMKALEIANKLNRKENSRLKKEINRVISSMKEVERVDYNEQPPRWHLKTEYFTPTVPSQANSQTSSYPNSSVHPQKTEKYIPHGLPTLESASSPPPPSVTDIGVQGEMSREQKVLETLRKSDSPLSALTIAKDIGQKSRRDVNPLLYKLKNEGLVEIVKSPSDNKPLWRATGPLHVRSLPSMSAGATDDHHMTLGSASAGILSPSAGDHHHTSAESGDRGLYTRTDSAGGAITFTPVAGLATVETPRQASSHINGSSFLNEVQVQTPIEESSHQNTPVSTPIQEGSSPQQVSQPTQVSIDDRATPYNTQQEPVAPPDPVNLVGPDRGGMTKRQKSATQAKDPDCKNMANLINDLNNLAPVGSTTEECSLDSQTESVLSTGDSLSTAAPTQAHYESEETGSHSLPLTGEDNPLPLLPSVDDTDSTLGSHQHSSTEISSQGASNESSLTGTFSTDSHSSKKRSSKRELAIKFPSAQPDT